jgi:hypothetical protein
LSRKRKKNSYKRKSKSKAAQKSKTSNDLWELKVFKLIIYHLVKVKILAASA